MPQSPQPLAIAIDIGSSSVRAVAFDSVGRPQAHTDHRERYRPETTADGGSMCDPLRMRNLVAKCVRKTCERLDSRITQVEVVGVSCHWHSLMGLNEQGTPVTPVYMWSDARSSADADTLRSELDEQTIHNRTGCRLHSSYWPAKIRWLHRERPDVSERVHAWCGLADWLLLAPGVSIKTSVSMASATGLMNTHALGWDRDLAEAIGVSVSSLPDIVDRSEHIPTSDIHPSLVPAGLKARWFPAIGDGAAANIGAGAVGAGNIALTIGTSGAIRLVRNMDLSRDLPPGLFRYMIDSRTEVLGGALSNGGNMMSWFSNLAGIKDQKAAMIAAAALTPDSHGLTVLPFFAGERAPSWQDRLGGTVTGMSLDTSANQIYRALLEATALRFARVYDDLKTFALPEHMIMASGGALLQSPQWCQITADALGHALIALPSRLEASARGAAISALQSAGILGTLIVPSEPHGAFSPSTDAHAAYKRARRRQELLETALTTWEQETTYDID